MDKYEVQRVIPAGIDDREAIRRQKLGTNSPLFNMDPVSAWAHYSFVLTL